MITDTLEATWETVPVSRAEVFEIQTRDWTIEAKPEADKDRKEDDDAACMRRIAAGDEAALSAIVARWYSPLMNFFYRSTGSSHDAEDLTQSVLVKLYRAAPRYRETARFSTFLFVIARRVLHNHRRFFYRKLKGLVDYGTVSESLLAEADDGRARELEEFFQTALKGLPEQQRTALLLRKQQGMGYGEIAEAMRTTESRVKTWIFRARRKLKEAYDEREA